MLIANESYDKEKIISLIDSPEELINYVYSLIPDIYLHLDSIKSNQRYYINFCVLEDKTIPMEIKQQLSQILVDGIHVVGFIDTFIPMNALGRLIDKNKVLRYYQERKS